MARANGKKTPAKNDLLALQATSASITTAAVTIQTLRLNGRQLTQSVFRQLPRRNLLNEQTLELLGTVWGWVNYDPDSEPRNRQFVVQFGEVLCRCPFWVRDVRKDYATNWPSQVERYGAEYEICAGNYILACALSNCLMGVKSLSKQDRYAQYDVYYLPERPFFGSYALTVGHEKHLDGGVHQAIRGMRFPQTERMIYPSSPTPVMEKFPQAEIDDLARKCMEHVRQTLERRTPDWEKPPNWWSAELDTIAAAADQYTTRWNALMNRLRSVEQLYIAA
jgi:hypothetical protein